MTCHFNRKVQKSFRQQLRRTMTPAEIILWTYLQQKQLKGYKFRRQQGIGPYVIDFYCSTLKFAIEIDGDSHFVTTDAQVHDKRRMLYLQNFGIRTIRFTNDEVCTNEDGVIATILRMLP